MFKSTMNFLSKNKKRKAFKKFLSMGISASLMMAMVPTNSAFTLKSGNFAASSKANHWGRSDLRAYLNGVKKENQTLPINTTNHARKSSDYYESNFSDKEYAIVKPFTYETNVLDDSQNEISTYTTTDKFWLPSGNANNGIVSWGSNDISSNAQYTETINNDKQHIIPMPYWSDTTISWLRSPDYSNAAKALCAKQGTSVITDDITEDNAFAAALKIDLSSILFASVASAKNIIDDSLTDNATSNAKKIEISGFSGSGAPSVDYGMYLKTKSNSSFSLSDIPLLSNNQLTINYSNGVEGQYIVVHVFKPDDLNVGTTNYVAAQKIEPNKTSAMIDVKNWNLNNFDGYTVKVWMEDGSGSLASATKPQSSPSDNSDQPSINPRAFALTSDLQTSWGTLNNATDSKGNSPTNQKIYFGNMAFWIAGRETAVNDGTVGPKGNIMTLYQAKPMADSQKKFNAFINNYKENPIIALQEGQSTTYTGSPVEFSGTVVYQNLEGNYLKLTGNNITYQYSIDDGLTWIDGMPSDVGIYQIRAKVAATSDYESATSEPVTFKVLYTPSASDFTFTAPDDLVYDGTAKIATVTGKNGMGTIIVKYYDSRDNELTSAPIEIGTYTVKIDVEEGSLYKAANLESDEWKFTIESNIKDTTEKELSSRQNEKSDENSSSPALKTGDKFTYFAILGLSSIIALAFILILNLRTNRGKFDK